MTRSQTPSATRTGVAAVVLGPRTRLGQALVARADAAGRPVLAVARDDRDAAALAPGPATVVRRTPGAALLPATADALHLHVCALGPVHPGAPDTDADAAAVARDLATVDALLDEAAGRPVHVVLVSTVIALAPGEDRRYYGGWKALVEQELRTRVERHPGAALSVLYPGRLVEGRGASARLHTGYDRLAGAVEQAAAGSPVSRVVGLDARLWLVANGLRLLSSSLSGSRRGPRRGTSTPDPRTESQVSS